MKRLIAMLSTASIASAAPAFGQAYHIVSPDHPLKDGEHLELRIVPKPRPGVRVSWKVGSSGFPSALYRAPYVIPVGTPPVQVTAGLSTPAGKESITREVQLSPGSAPGAEDCLGPGQRFSTVAGDLEEFVRMDELPVVINAVEPDYPQSELVREIEDTINVRALICRSGSILDAFALPVRRQGELIEQDPRLVEAAITAVMQYRFRPGVAGGQALATWIDIPVAFRR